MSLKRHVGRGFSLAFIARKQTERFTLHVCGKIFFKKINCHYKYNIIFKLLDSTF